MSQPSGKGFDPPDRSAFRKMLATRSWMNQEATPEANFLTAVGPFTDEDGEHFRISTETAEFLAKSSFDIKSEIRARKREDWGKGKSLKDLEAMFGEKKETEQQVPSARQYAGVEVCQDIGSAECRRRRRGDLYKVDPRSRPKRGQAAELPVDDDEKDLKKLDEDVRAKTTRASDGSHMSLIRSILVKRRMGPFPITIDKFRIVLAKLKKARYASAANYVSSWFAAVEERKEKVPPLVVKMMKRLVRSTRRDLGPPQQAAHFELDKVFVETSDRGFFARPLVEGGPIFPRETATLQSMFCTREIEAASMKIEDLNFYGHMHTLSVHFKKSKTDQEGFGEDVEYVCTCADKGGDKRPGFKTEEVKNGQKLCTFCLAWELVDKRKNYPDLRVSKSAVLFCDMEGEPVEKDKTAENFKEVAAMAAVVPRPGTSYGGHSARVIGARFLARQGLTLKQIMYAGRWTSEKTAMRYIGDAIHTVMSHTIAKDLKKKNVGCAKAPNAKPEEGAAPPPPNEKGPTPQFLFATRNKKLHKCRGGCTTRCGKHLCSFIVVGEDFIAEKCDKCFGPEID